MAARSTTAQRPPPKNPELREREERLESLKGTIGRLAHDFNNMLAPLLGYLTLIKEETPGGSSAGQYAHAMETAARRAEAHLESVLLAVRPNRRFSPREIDFAELVRREVEQWRKNLPPEAGIDLSIHLDACRLAADEQQWTAALQHLLANARFALAVGGRLQVTLTKTTFDRAQLDDLGLSESDCCKLVVSDCGFGMPPEIAKRAFEPFFTTRAQIKASGLGLTIVHSVAQVHGGQVLLETVEDEGTTVTILLPAAVPAAAETLGAASNKRGKSQPLGRTLLVERDPLAREVLRSWLQQRQLEVHAAENEYEADRIFQRYAADWKLLVVEAVSAESARFFEKLREANREIPAILLLNAKSCPEAILHGPNPPLVLQKPFTYRAFQETVQRQLQPTDR